MIFNMLKDKILFIFERYKFNDNKALALKNLLYLSITSFIIITRSFKLIFKNESNKNNFKMDFSKNISIKKKSISFFKAFKKMKIIKFNFIDIAENNASVYYHLIRKKKQAFFLIIHKIYDIFIKSLEILLRIKQNNYISINKLYLCGFEIKYKRFYKSYTLKNI